MFAVYEDIKGKEFEIKLYCTVFKKDCKDITREERIPFCHGFCRSCTESEEN